MAKIYKWIKSVCTVLGAMLLIGTIAIVIVHL